MLDSFQESWKTVEGCAGTFEKTYQLVLCGAVWGCNRFSCWAWFLGCSLLAAGGDVVFKKISGVHYMREIPMI